MSISFLAMGRISVVASVLVMAGACTEQVTAPGDSPGISPAVAAAPSPVKVTWCDVPPFTCAGAAVTLTPSAGRTAIEIRVRNLQGVGPIYGTRRWGIEKIKMQLPYGTLGVWPPDSESSVLLEQGTFGYVAPPVKSPQPWVYTVTAKVPIPNSSSFRDVVLLSGPALVGCNDADWGITSYYRTCPDTAVFQLNVPGAWDWKSVSWIWFVGHKHDCAFRRAWDINGKLIGTVMSNWCEKVAPAP